MEMIPMQYEEGPIIISSGSLHDINKPGIYYLTTLVTDKPTGSGGVYIVGTYNDSTLAGIYIEEYGNQVFSVRRNGNTWYADEISVPYVTTIKGTTTSSGALAVPLNYQDKFFVSGLLTTGGPGSVFRRDNGYLTVFNNNLQPLANTYVELQALFVNWFTR